jgi:hypothetical protein
MTFDSLTFIVFLALVYAGYWMVHSWTWRKRFLLAASWGFYAAWNPFFVLLLVWQLGLVATISDSTVWRWLSADAIRPWQHRCWIFPPDAQFAVKAGRIIDLYQRRWQWKLLRDDEFVRICPVAAHLFHRASMIVFMAC